MLLQPAVKSVSVGQGQLKNLSQMERPTAGRLSDLFPAGKAIGNDERRRLGAADGRQERAFPDLHRESLVFRFKPEGSRHAAAAGFGLLDFKAQAFQQLTVRRSRQDRLLMAVGLEDGTARNTIPHPRPLPLKGEGA